MHTLISCEGKKEPTKTILDLFVRKKNIILSIVKQYCPRFKNVVCVCVCVHATHVIKSCTMYINKLIDPQCFINIHIALLKVLETTLN